MALAAVACGGNAPGEGAPGAPQDGDGLVSTTSEALQTFTWSSAVLGNNTDQQTVVGDSWAKIAMMCELLQNENLYYQFYVSGSFVFAGATNGSPNDYHYSATFDSRDNANTFFSLSRALPGQSLQQYGYAIVPNNQQTLSSAGGWACIAQVKDPRKCVQKCNDGFSGYMLFGSVFP
jgi:hypothetical protein